MSSIYIAYEECKRKYNDLQKIYIGILEEQEELFAKTQPKSLNLNKISVAGGKKSNLLDDYLILKSKKQIDKRLKEIQALMTDRKILLDKKELELKNSKEWIDKLYVYKYLEKYKVKKIINLMPYESAQTYRMLNEIRSSLQAKKLEKIKDDRK